jgi:hypothetical protein
MQGLLDTLKQAWNASTATSSPASASVNSTPSWADRAIIRVQELWTGFFVDRQGHAALDELFNAGGPCGHMVALVAKLQGGVGSVCLPLVDCHGFELVFD